MGSPERDRYTGHMTTGHDWNGIKELNTPVPLVLFAFLGAAFLFALGYWILMPAWPLGDDYTRGKLGIDQRDTVEHHLAEAQAVRDGQWQAAFERAGFDEIRDDEGMMRIVRDSGPALYRDNCSMCHGSEGEGGLHFPRLSDQAWLWGDDPDDILHTLQVGINAEHPDSRVARMPAFGAPAMLDGQQIDQVVLYLRSRFDDTVGSGARADELLEVNAGERVYAAQCAACHGGDMKGNTLLGAPNLSDEVWLYGSDAQALHTTIRQGRGGWMPAWESRLDLAERKILTLHVLSLSDADVDADADAGADAGADAAPARQDGPR